MSVEDCEWLKLTITDSNSEHDKCDFVISSSYKINGTENIVKSEVRRSHGEFEWLNGVLRDNKIYEAYLIPPCPPKANFDAARDKFYRLHENEADFSREEYDRFKKELDNDYLYIFKKAVALHENYLMRLTSHTVFRNDPSLKIFLTYQENLEVRSLKLKERLLSFYNRVQQSGDQTFFFSPQPDPEPYFDEQRINVQCIVYHLDQVRRLAAKLVEVKLQMGQDWAVLCSALGNTSKIPEGQIVLPNNPELKVIWRNSIREVMVFGDEMRMNERKSAGDYDFKLIDPLQFAHAELESVRDLLYRRLKVLSRYVECSKMLEKSRKRSTSSTALEDSKSSASEALFSISTICRQELEEFHVKRVDYLLSNLNAHARLQMKHHHNILKDATLALQRLKAM